MSIFERRDQASALKRLSMVSSASSASCLTSLMRDNDVVKRGCLHMKRPPTNSAVKLRIKAWQKRYLVLRDAWTAEGDTSLELYDNDPSSPTNSITSTASVDDLSAVGRRQSGRRRQYVIDLRTVMYVDVYRDSKTFPNSFIVFRTGKSPLIFGAKSDLEMREWMMAIKLLADKVRAKNGRNDDVTSAANGASSTRSQRSAPPAAEQVPAVAARRRSELPPMLATTASTGSTRRDDAMRRSTPQLMTSSTGGCSVKIQHHNNNSSSKKDKSFPVRIQHYIDPSMTQRLHGDYLLSVGDIDLSLRHCRARSNGDVSTGSDVIARWLLCNIRKLKCESCDDGLGDVITLVTMSESPSNEGATYQFRTGCGLNVIRCVRHLVRKLDSTATTSKSRDDLTSVVGSVNSATVGSGRMMTSESSKTSSVRSTITSVSRSQPDLLESGRSQSCDDVIADKDCSNGSLTASVHRQFTQLGITSNIAGAGAFYLPLVDDDVSSLVTISSAGTSSGGCNDVELMTSSCKQTALALSRSTGALNSVSIHGGDLKRKNGDRGSAPWIAHGAPTPPPRPIHTISN